MAMRSEKKVVQDIVPSSRRTIRNISFEEETAARSGGRTRARREVSEEVDEDRGVKIPIHTKKVVREEVEYEERPAPKQRKKRRASGTLITFIIVFLCIAVIAVALSLLYSKAVVTIVPKVINIQVDGTFTAKKALTSVNSADLSYDVITQKATASSPIPATDGPFTQTKAKGTAYLYNEQSSAQKIVAGTRLSNTNGLIYRTVATVTIPAAKTTAGKLVPGSISSSIIADQAGAQYNMLLSDLTGDLKVVAYKGGDKYTKVYGRTKTDVVGGFLGNKKIISPEARKAAVDTLEASLKAKLAQQIATSHPEGSIVYDSASIYEYQVTDVTSKASSTAEVSVTATAYSIAFKSDTLLKAIGAKELERFPVPTYSTEGLDKLSFSIINAKDFSAKKGTTLIFLLKGPLKLTGTFPENTLKNELRGITLEASNPVFARYPAIGNAQVLITPFWMRSFPNSASKITLEVKTE